MQCIVIDNHRPCGTTDAEAESLLSQSERRWRSSGDTDNDQMTPVRPQLEGLLGWNFCCLDVCWWKGLRNNLSGDKAPRLPTCNLLVAHFADTRLLRGGGDPTRELCVVATPYVSFSVSPLPED